MQAVSAVATITDEPYDEVQRSNARRLARLDPRPAVVLRDELARARGQGLDFSEAWPAALSLAVEGLDQWQTRDWSVAFAATQPAWACAFAQAPFLGCSALAALMAG